MKVLLPDPTYDHEDKDPPEQFLADMQRQANALSPEHKTERRDLGHGASWPMFIIAFAAVFVSGKRINENIEAWIDIAKKFRKFFKWIDSRCVSQWVDEEASVLLALEAVAEEHPDRVKSIELMFSSFVSNAEVSLADGNSPDFQPVGVYIHAYRVNQLTTYTVVVQSTGEIEAIVPVTPENPFGL